MNDVAILGRPRRLNATLSNLADCGLIGFLCSTSTGGTLAISDGSGVLLAAMACTAGQYYPLNIRCTGAVTITVGGTLDGMLSITA